MYGDCVRRTMIVYGDCVRRTIPKKKRERDVPPGPWQATMPSYHVCSRSVSPSSPHILNHEPPGKQQLYLSDTLCLPHWQRVDCGTIESLILVTLVLTEEVAMLVVVLVLVVMVLVVLVVVVLVVLVLVLVVLVLVLVLDVGMVLVVHTNI